MCLTRKQSDIYSFPMTQEPQTWHYGLVAQYWAEFNVDGPEIPYFQGLIERYGQPVLDVGCGAGRLLLPYLRAGLDVDGCDVSADMLALCRKKAEQAGYAPRLFHQAMHELQPPRTYRTIIVCGTFGIGGSVRQDQEALRCFYRWLEPGGALLLENYLAYRNPDGWQYWLAAKRAELPAAWPTTGRRKQAADGTEYELRSRLAAFNPLEQLATRQIRVYHWRDSQLLAQEERTLLERFYFKHEVLLMLAEAGFHDVEVQGDHTGHEATASHGILVFVARK
jgi:SAM-dependent methyltransferase